MRAHDFGSRNVLILLNTHSNCDENTVLFHLICVRYSYLISLEAGDVQLTVNKVQETVMIRDDDLTTTIRTRCNIHILIKVNVV